MASTSSVIFVTQNRGKADEIATLLAGVPVRWERLPLAHVPGDDLEAAASGRVSEAFRRLGAPCFLENTGLWVHEHGIDEQRGYQIVCLLYGSDPETMGPLAGRLGLPEERRESCIPEAARNAASWAAYLAPQAAQLQHQLDGFLVPVRYQEPGSATADAARRARELKLLEGLQTLLHSFKFPEGKVMVRLR